LVLLYYFTYIDGARSNTNQKLNQVIMQSTGKNKKVGQKIMSSRVGPFTHGERTPVPATLELQ